MAGNTGVVGAGVTSRIMAILGAFDEHHVELSLTAIARRAELPLSTAHRLVTELVELGALARSAHSRDYVIGRRLWDIGLLAPVERSLREAASPFLHDIYAATLATVHLAVRDGEEVLYVERLRGRASVEIVSTVGSTLPLFTTGVGKVLLAHAPVQLQHSVLAQLRPVTAYTITEPATLRSELDRIRRDDVATTDQEMSLGAASIAVPIRRGSEVVAAVGVVVPSLSRERGRMVTALQVAARGIGRQL